MSTPTTTGTDRPAPPRTMGQLYAVTDNHLTVHAGRVGHGILCNLTPRDPTIHTGRRPESWHDDVSKVDCGRCIRALRDQPAPQSQSENVDQAEGIT